MLAVNLEEPPEVVVAWVRGKRLSVDVLLDPPGIAARAWAITATPTAFLVDRQGRVVARAVGTRAWTGPEGRAVIEDLLGK